MELVFLFSRSLFVHEMLTHCLVYRDGSHLSTVKKKEKKKDKKICKEVNETSLYLLLPRTLIRNKHTVLNPSLTNILMSL